MWTPVFPEDEEKIWGLDTSFPLCVWGELCCPSWGTLRSAAMDLFRLGFTKRNGLPFTVAEDDEEWMGWINWEAIRARTGGAGASSS